ncbi:MAG: hypothetical protein WBB22_08270 [Anaerolineae bacterium]
MIDRSRWLRMVMLLGLTLLMATACGQAPSPPTATPTLVPTTLTPTFAPPTATPTSSPTATRVPATPAAAPLEGEGLLGWTVAADGAVFVLDATHTLYQL